MKEVMLIVSRTSARSIFFALTFNLVFAMTGFAATDTFPCAANSVNRQLDYWLGDWKIGAEGSSGSAHSTISLSLDKCLVVENWDGGKGHRGQNIFGYSADDKSWYGMFADNEGRVHVFSSGKVADGTAEFEGASRGPHGESVLNRVKVVRLNSNKVEQIWEKSNNNGASWSVVFRGEYSRANP
jgi:hypothetical protein